MTVTPDASHPTIKLAGGPGRLFSSPLLLIRARFTNPLAPRSQITEALVVPDG